MKFKYLFMSVGVIIFTFLFSQKVSAIDIGYCSYGDLKLTLPVTIKVNLEGINMAYPFDENKKYHYSNSLYVYNQETCNSSIAIPFLTSNNGLLILKEGTNTYYINRTFSYSYNGSYINTNSYLSDGIYSVIDTTPPTINSSHKEFFVSMDSIHDLEFFSKYVSAYDTVDSQVIYEIVFDNYTDNYNIPGTYNIIYSSCDKSNNCSKFTQTINVIDNTPPTIIGIEKINSYMSNPLSLFQIGNMLEATDNYDGNISSAINLTDSHYDINYPGIYYAYFSVSDSSGNKVISPHKVTINYMDDIIPNIEGASKFTSYLSSPISIKEILSNLVATDNIEGNINSTMFVLSDNYTQKKEHIGEYSIVVSCFDTSGNEANPYTININVVDDIAPHIEGKSEYISYLSNPITLNDIKSNLIALDNHDGNITHKIEYDYENYSTNKNNIGIFYVSFFVKDNSSNISDTFKIEIKVFDDVLPIISGQSSYITLTSEKLNVDSIKFSLYAIDNVDDDISHLIELNDNNYTSNYNIPGTYYLTYYVGDKSGNISIPFKIKIVVNENMTFIRSINNTIIYLNTGKLKQTNDIITLLNIQEMDYMNVSVIENTYSSNFDNPGEYKIVYEFTNTDYTKEFLNIKINTYEDDDKAKKEIKTEQKKKESILSYILTFFKNIFTSFLNVIPLSFSR